MVPDDENILRDLAKKHEESKDYYQAAEEYKKLINLNNSYYVYPLKAGYCMYKMEKYSEAIHFYELSLQTIMKEENPNKNEIASLHLLIGDCYKGLQDPKKAKEEYGTYLSTKKDPKAKDIYNKRMAMLKKRKRKTSKRSPYLEPLASIILEVISFIIIAAASFVPFIGFTATLVSVSANVNASIFTATIINSSGTSTTGGYFGPNSLWPNDSILVSQIMVYIILLSIIVLLIMDLLAVIYVKNKDIPNFVRHYGGLGVNPLTLIFSTFVCLALALYGVLNGSPLSSFVVRSTEHIESGLYLFIAGMVLYIIRGFLRTNPNYVKRTFIKKSTIKRN